MHSFAEVEREAITAVFRNSNSYPTPVSAAVNHETDTSDGTRYISISTVWSQVEHTRATRLPFSQNWTLQCDHKSVLQCLPPSPCTHTNRELLSSYSPSGTYRAVISQASGRQYLEVWSCSGLQTSLDLTALNVHGAVYEDAALACLAWMASERQLLYVAEKKRPAKAETSSSSSSSPPPAPPPPFSSPVRPSPAEAFDDKSVYVEDWGEGLTGRSSSVLCVADLDKGHVIIIKSVPQHTSPAQALWTPDGEGVIYVGLFEDPFRLGLKFCSNRRSSLYHLDLQGHLENLADWPAAGQSVSCPRLSPDGRWLVYLKGEVFGPHHQCLRLQQYDWQTKKTSVLLDVVKRPKPGEFAGIYEALPSRCWSSDSQRIIFSSARGNYKDLFVLDIITKRVTRLSDTSEFGCWKLLLVHKDLLVVSCSAPNRPPRLRVGFLPPAGGEAGISWVTLNDPSLNCELEWRAPELSPAPQEENLQFSGLRIGVLLVKRVVRDRSKLPLVVFIHGGPHSQFCAEWIPSVAALANLGYAVLMVNYRGSTGFGQDSILSLTGNIGCQDVKDVQRAVLYALQDDVTLDPQRVVVMGGSHGGFLACHLVGQHPDFYKACAARNPVINAATLVGTSDIVDWRYSSMGLKYSFGQVPTSEALSLMLERSPIIHAEQIRAPVLLMLGAKDRRVSPHQGLELYRALKSRNSPVRLLWFVEDGHSLGSVETQADCFINIVLWFQQALKSKRH